MKHLHYTIAVFVFGFFFMTSCTQKDATTKQDAKSNVELTAYSPENGQSNVGPDFNNYWYQGKAELTSFDLQQARYGEIHEGHAVLIFVTEDFWSDKQVKYEFGTKTKNVVPTLKLNFTKKFNTGIYPYSLMTSSFTPVEGKQPFKLTSSMQEWCGQAYMQINQRNKNYEGFYHSYFQAEGDKEFTLPKDAVFEDAIWTQIRKNPKNLPKGNFQAVPDLMFMRLLHKEVKAYKATGKLEANRINSFYTINYPNLNRSIKIQFETAFPHKILAWEEMRTSRGRALTTVATRKKSVMSPYWSLNGVADSVYRKELELP